MGFEETRLGRVVGYILLLSVMISWSRQDYIGSVLSPLLFIIVLKALIKEIRSRRPQELLDAADLVLVEHLRVQKGG